MNQKAIQILQKADVDKLPSLPHILLHLLEICHDESLSYSELATILRQDPGLYARVYSVCNRNQCNRNRQQQLASEPQPGSQTAEQTLEKLGINTIKSIAVTAAVQQFFSRSNIERTDFIKQHWQHSLYCASVAESIAKHCNYKDPGEAYTTGLLHDIGQLVIESAFPEKYTVTFAQLSEDENFHTLELDEFGTTHQLVGAEMLKKHGANSFICDAVLYHHEPITQILDAHPLVKIINLANLLTSSYFKEEDQQVFDNGEELLGLNKALLLEILEKSQERVSTIAKKLEINLAFDGKDGETTKQHNAIDDFKQIQLAEQVRNIALLDGIHQHLSRSAIPEEGKPQALLKILSQHIGMLFGVNRCILFLYDAADDSIKAIPSDELPQQLADISIPLIAGRSLLTDALLNKEAMHSFNLDTLEHESLAVDNSKLAIIDRQLIGITGQEGMICLPMMMNNAAIGTLVLGVDKTQFISLWKQQPLLMRFVNEVSHTISVNHITGRPPASEKERNSELEQKIREVLHEVRNPLSIMNNYLGILSFKLESDKPAQEDVATIKTEIERVGQILNRLSSNEESTDTTSPIDINAIIADLTHVFQTSLFASKNIQISLDLDDRIETLNSNANAIKQIYTNLIKNAVEALPANGQLMVYTQDYVNVDGKEHIELSVADDGPGISTDILPQLFSPVDSTKGDDHAGLGLTIVKNLVNELHGSISCRSSDKGTSFHILLPK